MDEPNNTEKSSIDRLSEELYSREGQTAIPRKELHERESTLERNWASTSSLSSMAKVEKILEGSLPKKIFIAALVFLVAALGIASFVFFRGANIVSSRNVEVAVEGPVSIGGGETLELELDIVNKNAATLQTADLLVEFPDGTRDPVDISKELPRHRESLGNIRSGDRINKKISAVVFGEEGERKEVKISIEYRVADSNAIFVKESLFSFEINSAPVTILLDIPDSVSSGQDMEIKAEVISNSEEPIENVLLVGEYPFGFDFKNAAPLPVRGEGTWSIGTLEPGERKAILVRGELEGQDNEERTFRFTVGIPSEKDERVLGTPFLTSEHTISISRAFVGVNVLLNGSPAKEVVISNGRDVRGEITWINNLPVKVSDVVIEAKLEGSLLDEESVEVDKGFYDSRDNTIRWDRGTESSLALLGAGATSRATFSFLTKDLQNSGGNPQIVIHFSVTGTRAEGGSAGEAFHSFDDRVVKIATDLALVGKALHFSGPFENKGPLPPEADEETTYTIVWTLTNPTSDVENALVTAQLPTYMDWLGEIDPTDESVSYDDGSGMITWNAGDIKAGSGFTLPAREVAFQVSLTPSISQIGTAPLLIGEATLRADDAFTGSAITDFIGALSTRLTSDSSFTEGQSRVVEGE